MLFSVQGVVRSEETAITSVRWAHDITGKVIVARCGIHVTDNEGGTVAV